eukprot:sb/3464900/
MRYREFRDTSENPVFFPDLFFNGLGLPVPTRKTFDKYNAKVLYPTINRLFTEMRDKRIEVLNKENPEGCKISGDGQYDSMGKSAYYCTYSFMDEGGWILETFVLPRKAIAGTGNLEARTMRPALLMLIAAGLKISDIVTDRDTSVAKMLREDPRFILIGHHFDVWHMARNLRLAIAKVKALEPYQKSVCNHFWYAAKNCGKDGDRLINIFHSCLIHLTNCHSWGSGKGKTRLNQIMKMKTGSYPELGDMKKCTHVPLTVGEKNGVGWLDPKSDAFKKLFDIVTDEKRCDAMKKCAEFLHTGLLESFHSMKLNYLPKFRFFSINTMIALTQFAAMQNNLSQAGAVTKSNGFLFVGRNKSSSRHFARQKRCYDRIPLINLVLEEGMKLLNTPTPICKLPNVNHAERNKYYTVPASEKPSVQQLLSQQINRLD